MTPQEFIAKWHNVQFGEKQASQEMFLDICALVGHPTPVAYGNSDVFTFEKSVPGGFADAYLEEHFGWEFKGSDAQLPEAINQLLRYQVYLKTPPLLIVSSFDTIHIRTNFPGMETILHVIPVAALDQTDNLAKLRNAFSAPGEFRPNRTVEEVTQETANLFRDIVADMEQHNEDPERLARYLNQIVFCLYAEDAGLLPDGLFSEIVRRQFRRPDLFNQAVDNLFAQMSGGGLFGSDEIPHFNGDLFHSADTVELSTTALQRLGEATQKNWRNIEPSIFGTLFERALDASKRSQLGAHYTGADDIMLVIDPVVMEPLRREWDATRHEVGELQADGDDAAARTRLVAFQQRLAGVTVLDPACGSGNFLYLALRSLLDLEQQAIDFGAAQGWDDLAPTVKPNQMLGLEINHYAAELARTSLWIGYIQWHQSNGFLYRRHPILTPLHTIRQTDAILDQSDPDNPTEPEWPAAEFIIGNPPFLGNKMMRLNLGDVAVDAIYSVYGGRLPKGSDICCYWFEKARSLIADGKSKRAGLLGTQGIRGGANRTVLQRIAESGGIFEAHSDREWVLDGAAVHISIVGFDDGSAMNLSLNNTPVANINSDLTTGPDLTQARRLDANAGLSFMGVIPVGPFEIESDITKQMLRQPNPHGKPNADVIKRWIIGRDISQVSRDMWIIDFGTDMSATDAALYEAPFEYVLTNVKPLRDGNRDAKFRNHWWLHGRPRIEMRSAINDLDRYIVTPATAKYRMFKWLQTNVLPDHSLIVITRDDDYTFGILHSRIHELWARAKGTQLREAESGFRYTPTTCFETFPFPHPTDEQREAIAAAAAELNRLRENWLNPADVSAAELRRRTLTNLYNEYPTWLANAHATLDAAVADAYGWPADSPDQQILERLLALNLERAAAEAQKSE